MQGKPLYSTNCKYFSLGFPLCFLETFLANIDCFVLLSLMNEVVHTSPTIGSNVEEIVVKNTHFLMWDIGGQESLRSSWNTYYSNTEVRNTNFTTLLLLRGTYVLSSSHFLPEHGSWCICSEHGQQQGPPRSEVTISQRGPSEQQCQVCLLSVWRMEREKNTRRQTQMLGYFK